MNKKELFWEAVDRAYEDDGLILQYVKDPEGEHGDGLAEFIVRELRDLSSGEPGDTREAAQRISRAKSQLSDVAALLSGMADTEDEE